MADKEDLIADFLAKGGEIKKGIPADVTKDDFIERSGSLLAIDDTYYSNGKRAITAFKFAVKNTIGGETQELTFVGQKQLSDGLKIGESYSFKTSRISNPSHVAGEKNTDINKGIMASGKIRSINPLKL